MDTQEREARKKRVQDAAKKAGVVLAYSTTPDNAPKLRKPHKPHVSASLLIKDHGDEIVKALNAGEQKIVIAEKLNTTRPTLNEAIEKLGYWQFHKHETKEDT